MVILFSDLILVGGLDHGFYFPIQLGMSQCHHPNWLSLHDFSEGLAATTNQILLGQDSSDFHVA